MICQRQSVLPNVFFSGCLGVGRRLALSKCGLRRNDVFHDPTRNDVREVVVLSLSQNSPISEFSALDVQNGVREMKNYLHGLPRTRQRDHQFCGIDDFYDP